MTPRYVKELKKNKNETGEGTSRFSAEEWMGPNYSIYSVLELLGGTPTFNDTDDQLIKSISALGLSSVFTDIGTQANKLVLRRPMSPLGKKIFMFDTMTIDVIVKTTNTGPVTVRFEHDTLEYSVMSNGESLPADFLDTTVKYELMFDNVSGVFNIIGGAKLDGTGTIGSTSVPTATSDLETQSGLASIVVSETATHILVDTSSVSATVVLPTASANRHITIKDEMGTSDVNNITVVATGSVIRTGGTLERSFLIDVSEAAVSFLCVEKADNTFVWHLV